MFANCYGLCHQRAEGQLRPQHAAAGHRRPLGLHPLPGAPARGWSCPQRARAGPQHMSLSRVPPP